MNSTARLLALALDAATGNGALTTYLGSPEDEDRLHLHGVPIRNGELGVPVRISTNASNRCAAFDYMGLTANGAGVTAAWGEVSEFGYITIGAARLHWRP